MTSLQDAPARDRAPLGVRVRKATQADAPKVSAVMARAFDDDPLANWACAQDARRSRRIYDFMDFATRKLTLPHNEVYTTDEHQGGALWTPPGKWKMGMLQQLLAVSAFARCTTWKRLPKVMSGLNAVEKKHPREPHYYLLGLGVDPELQGRSIGTQLMAPVLAMCDRDGVPAYLESSKEVNIPLYERNGFRVTEELVIPGDGPRTWLMWRAPR